MPLAGVLDRAWIEANAALPPGWHVCGLQHGGPHPTSAWYASARDEHAYKGVEGTGAHPAQALTDLAAKLREIQGSANG